MSGLLLWDNCMVWGLALHHFYKFLSHLRKLKMTGRTLAPFLWSKAAIYSPHFYANKFYKGSQTEEKCQISLLPKHFRQDYSGLLQLRKLWYFSTSPTPQYLPIEWVFLGWAIPSIFQLVGYSSVSFRQAPPTIQTLGRYTPGHFNCPPQYLPTGRGADNLLYHQIKLRIFNQKRRSKN